MPAEGGADEWDTSNVEEILRHGRNVGGICQEWLVWWAHQDLNLEPTDYESAALTN